MTLMTSITRQQFYFIKIFLKKRREEWKIYLHIFAVHNFSRRLFHVVILPQIHQLYCQTSQYILSLTSPDSSSTVAQMIRKPRIPRCIVYPSTRHRVFRFIRFSTRQVAVGVQTASCCATDIPMSVYMHPLSLCLSLSLHYQLYIAFSQLLCISVEAKSNRLKRLTGISRF